METPAEDLTKPIKRTPGTGGVIELWKKDDGTPTKLATGPWAEGRGKPQGVGKRWRGWYVGDDGKPHTKRFRTEVEAKGWSDTERGKVVTNQWVSPDVGADTFRAVAERWFTTKEGAQRKPKMLAGYRSILDTLVLPRWGDTPMKEVIYPDLSAWIAGLSVNGSQAGTSLSASRIRQTHHLRGECSSTRLGLGWRPRTSPLRSTAVTTCPRRQKQNSTT
jgi:hypothetical protein